MRKKTKLIFGVGVNDATYCVYQKIDNKIVACPFYVVWVSMLRRCYSGVCHGQHPTYVGCSVCDEWLNFSTFKMWMETQDWEGKQLDKDVLTPDNKIYRPEACVFLSRMINVFTTERTSARGIHPIGVTFLQRLGKYQSNVRNPFTGKKEYLGLFDSPVEAHHAWRMRKIYFASQLGSLQNDQRVTDALISRYENYQNIEEL